MCSIAIPIYLNKHLLPLMKQFSLSRYYSAICPSVTFRHCYLQNRDEILLQYTYRYTYIFQYLRTTEIQHNMPEERYQYTAVTAHCNVL